MPDDLDPSVRLEQQAGVNARRVAEDVPSQEGLLTSEDGASWSSTGIPQPAMPNAYAVSGDVILFLVDGTVYSG